MSGQECGDYVTEMCTAVKDNLKIYPTKDHYKSEFITTGFLDNEKLMRFHRSMDCFVMPSYGEAWCIPAFDAMGFGNTPICSDVGGPSEFMKNGGGSLVPTRKEPVFGMLETFSDIYTGHENWWGIDIRALQKEMRGVFEMWKNDKAAYSEAKKQGRLSAEQYSYKNVGLLIKKELENAG